MYPPQVLSSSCADAAVSRDTPPDLGVCLQPLLRLGPGGFAHTCTCCWGLLAAAARCGDLLRFACRCPACSCAVPLSTVVSACRRYLAAVPYCGRSTRSCRVCLQLPDLMLRYACSCLTCYWGMLTVLRQARKSSRSSPIQWGSR
jgi:hypothetical protein